MSSIAACKFSKGAILYNSLYGPRNQYSVLCRLMDKWCLIPETVNYIAMLKIEVDFGWTEKRCPLRRDVDAWINFSTLYFTIIRKLLNYTQPPSTASRSLVYHDLLNVLNKYELYNLHDPYYTFLI